jgi:hypothetical protein
MASVFCCSCGIDPGEVGEQLARALVNTAKNSVGRHHSDTYRREIAYVIIRFSTAVTSTEPLKSTPAIQLCTLLHTGRTTRLSPPLRLRRLAAARSNRPGVCFHSGSG